MPLKKLLLLVSLIGLVILVVSIIWWQRSFGLSTDMLKCIAFNDTVCKIGGGLKSVLKDIPTYNPIAFWVGLLAFIGGALLRKIF